VVRNRTKLSKTRHTPAYTYIPGERAAVDEGAAVMPPVPHPLVPPPVGTVKLNEQGQGWPRSDGTAERHQKYVLKITRLKAYVFIGWFKRLVTY